MSESWSEQLDRVRGMAAGEETWDLSENDKAALNAVLAEVPAWRVIETMPKNGQWVLVVMGEFRPTVARRSEGGWEDCENCGPTHHDDWPVTHWMPLPRSVR